MRKEYNCIIKSLNLKADVEVNKYYTDNFTVETTFLNILNSNIKEMIERKMDIDLELLYKFIKSINRKYDNVKVVIDGYANYNDNIVIKSCSGVNMCEYDDCTLDLQRCDKDYFKVDTYGPTIAKTLTKITDREYTGKDITDEVRNEIRNKIYCFANILFDIILHSLSNAVDSNLDNYVIPDREDTYSIGILMTKEQREYLGKFGVLMSFLESNEITKRLKGNYFDFTFQKEQIYSAHEVMCMYEVDTDKFMNLTERIFTTEYLFKDWKLIPEDERLALLLKAFNDSKTERDELLFVELNIKNLGGKENVK